MIEYIYALICPVSNEIKYIGKSKNPKTRYNQHIRKLDKQLTPKRRWLEGLFEKGLKPDIKILKECKEGDGRELEQYYCDMNRNTILNIHNPGKGMKSNKWGE